LVLKLRDLRLKGWLLELVEPRRLTLEEEKRKKRKRREEEQKIETVEVEVEQRKWNFEVVEERISSHRE
jgi:hypothetical protein